MPIDLSNPTGFNKFWTDTIDQFLRESVGLYEDSDPNNWTIPSNLQDGSGDPILNDVVRGPADPSTFFSQYSVPIAWVVPTNHSPSYATVNTDHGTLAVSVVIFVGDTDAQAAFDKARELGGRVVNNVEGSALVDSGGTAHAGRVDLEDFQMDSRPFAQQGAQIKFCEMTFHIQVERDY